MDQSESALVDGLSTFGPTPDWSSEFVTLTEVGPDLGSRTHWYYFKDGLGSIVAVVDQSGAVQNRYSYDPYGKASSSGSASNPLGYTGGYLDSTGLMKFGARYYDPNLGRWTETESAQASPAYVYAGDDPVNMVDPSGAMMVCDCGSGGGAAPGTTTPSVSPSPPPSAIATTMPPPPSTSSSSNGQSSNCVPMLVSGAAVIIVPDLFYGLAMVAAVRAGQPEAIAFMESPPVVGVFLADNALGVWLIAQGKCNIHP